MRISILGPSYPYRGGGVHTNIGLVKALRARKNVDLNVHVWKRLYPSFLLPKPEGEFKDGSKHKLDVPNSKRVLDYVNPFSWIKVVADVRKFKSEIFITHWQQTIQFPVLFFIFLALKLTSKTKIYLVAHNIKQHEKSLISPLMTRLILSLTDRVMTHSRAEAVEATKYMNNSKVVHAFLPTNSIFREIKRSKEELRKSMGITGSKVLLYFGFIRPYKGVEYLIRAIPGIRKKYPDLTVIIAGELFWQSKEKSGVLKRLPFKILKFLAMGKNSSQEYNPLSLVEELGIQDNVLLVNEYIPNEDLSKYFKVADALVLPYRSVTQSAIVQNAYDFKIPVLASNLDGLKEVIGEGESGMLFETENSGAIVGAVDEFYSSGKDWTQGVTEYRKRFTWDKYISLLLA